MILTKEEFLKQFEYNSLPSVHRLIRDGKIKLTSDDMIDTTENEDFCKKRIEKLKKIKRSASKTKKQNQKNAHQLSLEIDAMNSRLDEHRTRTELLRLKIAKEKGTVIETSVLSRVVRATFDDMIKTLTEFPNIYASEIINIVRAEEKPKEILTEYLTEKIISSIKMGLDNAKKTAKKYYEK